MYGLVYNIYSFRAHTDYHHPVDPDSYTAVVARGVADLYPYWPVAPVAYQIILEPGIIGLFVSSSPAECIFV